MTAVAESRSALRDALGGKVLSAARLAWQAHGEPLEEATTKMNEGLCLAGLTAARSRRVEFVVEEDDTAVWDALVELEPVGQWTLCALVPLSLLGVAHERLRGHGYDLQAWWLRDGKVMFGSVEIA